MELLDPPADAAPGARVSVAGMGEPQPDALLKSKSQQKVLRRRAGGVSARCAAGPRCDAMRCDAMRCDAMRCDAESRGHVGPLSVSRWTHSETFYVYNYVSILLFRFGTASSRPSQPPTRASRRGTARRWRCRRAPWRAERRATCPADGLVVPARAPARGLVIGVSLSEMLLFVVIRIFQKITISFMVDETERRAPRQRRSTARRARLPR